MQRNRYLHQKPTMPSINSFTPANAKHGTIASNKGSRQMPLTPSPETACSAFTCIYLHCLAEGRTCFSAVTCAEGFCFMSQAVCNSWALMSITSLAAKTTKLVSNHVISLRTREGASLLFISTSGLFQQGLLETCPEMKHFDRLANELLLTWLPLSICVHLRVRWYF